jgi:peptide deformylase
MDSLTVLHCPNPELRKVSSAIAAERFATPEMQELIAKLKVTMAEENGIGIAAPQVGIHERVIIVDMEDTGPTAFYNPEITQRSFKMIDSEEGCLSVPGQWGIVKRHRAVTVKAFDEAGQPVQIQANGLMSTVFQHEIDHLDGILFIDRAEEIQKTGKRL